MVKELAENKPRVVLIGQWHKIISTVLQGNEMEGAFKSEDEWRVWVKV